MVAVELLLELDLGLVDLLGTAQLEGLFLVLVELPLLWQFGLEDGRLGEGEFELESEGFGLFLGFCDL
jgi:hypothetical protein